MKKYVNILLLFVVVVFLVGCGKSSDDYNGSDIIRETEGEYSNSSSRLVIYTVSARTNVANVQTSIDTMKNFLENDEWIESENQSTGYARITFRIKTSRLETFIDELNGSFTLENMNRSSEDVSLNYYDITSRISALELQRARLVELYETADFSTILAINEQISKIDAQLVSLNRQKNEYDSDIEYSSVTISLNSEETEQSYGSFFGESVLSIWKVFIRIGGILLIAVAAFSPLAIIIVPIVIISKKKAKKNKYDFTKYDK